MFDMIDVIQMTKISKHYLLEYQTLLDTYEMQAPNVTSGFRVLDFSDDISDVDYTSDDWSMNESYSETSGEMTNSVQTNILANPPEYSVCAGSKPLSIIIRRCNTPTVACSPLLEIEKQNSCTKGKSEQSGECDETNSLPCKAQEALGCSESEKDTICNISESIDIVNTSTKDTELNGSKEEISICSEEVTYNKSPSKEITNAVSNDDSYVSGEEKDVDHVQKCDESCQVLNENNSLSEVSLLPCIEENSQNDSFPFFGNEEDNKKVLDDVIQKVVDDLCPPNERDALDSSEHVSCSISDVNSSCNIEGDKIHVPKEEPHLRDELYHCVNVVSASSNSIFRTSQVDSVNLNFTSETAEDLEVSYLTSSFCHENSDLESNKTNVIETCVTEQSTLCLNESLEIHPSELVEGWRQSNCSPLLFSSDDESSSIAEEVNRGIEAALAPSPQYNVVLSVEKKKVGKLQELLMGAPPPPAVTMPVHSAADMLEVLRDPACWTLPDSSNTCGSSRLHWYQEAAAAPWPLVRCLQYPGVHYNHGNVSEQFEALCQKLLARCVGAETASSVTVWSSFTLPAPRRERRALSSRRSGSEAPTGLSPGRRLSHLARRHRTFSSAALLNEGARLQSTLPHGAPERRTILVDSRKKESRKHRSSQKKSNYLDRARDVHAMKVNSSKRALFQSPTEEKKTSGPSKFRPSSASAVRSRRALFMSEEPESQIRQPSTSNGVSASASTNASASAIASASAGTNASASRKRTWAESEGEMCERLPRRRLFSETDPNAHPVTNKGSCRQSELSSTHKKKLLWAVAEALKKRGVSFSHPQFRACAAALASTCRGHVHGVLALRQGSTSDRLLQLALRFVDGAVAQHVTDLLPNKLTESKEEG